MSQLVIVMYHYVRSIARSRYPAIKGREVNEFELQLRHIEREFTVVTAEAVMDAIEGGGTLPAKAVWLTFDDGLADHYTNVFPLLRMRGWQGSFFPPARAVLQGELLDVHKAHFILACEPDHGLVVSAVRDAIARETDDRLKPFEDYWRSIAVPSRFDEPETVFVKRMLQHALPEDVRTRVADELFARFVSIDPATFAAELYVSAEQLRLMIADQMYVGSHGDTHRWLDRLDPDEQRAEVDNSLAFLKEVGARTDRWVISYPNGAYDASLLDVLVERSCVAGLTTKVGSAQIGIDAPLELHRVDTNDLAFR